MKYHSLYIDTNGTKEHCDQITEILGVESTYATSKLFPNPYDTWTFSVEVDDEAPYYDFINEFLDIVEPKLHELKKIGVTENEILIWLVYEYDQQCSLSFNPQEMKRIGTVGINLNIDCREKSLNETR